MKALHYLFGLPPVRTGGLPRYAIDLMHGEQRAGIDVCMLIPGPIRMFGNKNVRIRKWKKWQELTCYRIINPLYIPNAYGMMDPKEFMTPAQPCIYRKWLEQIRPDIIHVHSLMGLHYEFIQAANNLKIPVVYTTHDFFGLCPAATLLQGDRLCSGKDWTQCAQCSVDAYSFNRLWLEQTALYRFYLKSAPLTKLLRGRKKHSHGETAESIFGGARPEIIRDYEHLKAFYRRMFDGITFFHYNSRQTKDIFDSLIGVRAGKTVLISNSSISDRRVPRKYGKLLRIGYLGSAMPLKGYDYLINTLKKLFDEGSRDFILNVYSQHEDLNGEFIRRHKPYQKNELSKVFDDMDVLVVPSLCNETFGMVVPEALSYGVPVIVSERVGAKALLEAWPGTGIIYDVSSDGLYSQIRRIYFDRSILAECNRNILDCGISFDFSAHVREILELYKLNLAKG